MINTLRRSILLFISQVFLFLNVFAQQTITGTFEVDEGAANSSIAVQYTSPSFPKEVSGSASGFDYTLYLDQPLVSFVPNFMQVHFHLRAETSIGNYDWDLSPAIYINYSASLDDVVALIDDFPTYINLILSDVPQWLRDVVIQSYQNLELQVYPGKVLEYVESRIPDDLDIEISNLGFDPIESLQGKVSITASFTAQGIPPVYLGYSRNRNFFKIQSSIAVDVKEMDFRDLASGDIYWSWSGNVHIVKDGEAVFQFHCDPEEYGDDCHELTTTQPGRKVVVLFESERGRFLRVYTVDIMPMSNEWVGPRSYHVVAD